MEDGYGDQEDQFDDLLADRDPQAVFANDLALRGVKISSTGVEWGGEPTWTVEPVRPAVAPGKGIGRALDLGSGFWIKPVYSVTALGFSADRTTNPNSKSFKNIGGIE